MRLAEFVVEEMLVQVLVVERLYWTVYPVAPVTTPQFSFAPLAEIFVVVNVLGALQEVDPPVVKFTDAE